MTWFKEKKPLRKEFPNDEKVADGTDWIDAINYQVILKTILMSTMNVKVTKFVLDVRLLFIHAPMKLLF